MKINTLTTLNKGNLSFFESNRDIPFPIKRIYYIHGVPVNVRRGGHAHKALQQLLFCPYGSIEIMLDDGKSRESVLLDRPDKGLLLGPGLWREMLWKKDHSVLCVAASEYYDESDYIRDYAAFLSFVSNGEDVAENALAPGAADKDMDIIYGGGLTDEIFRICRLYYIHSVPKGVERGGHAHRKLEQMLFCPYGSILVRVDDGREKWDVLLDSPEKRLYMPPYYWHSMLWKEDNSILCVAASDYYDESDYIRNYDEFMQFIGEGES